MQLGPLTVLPPSKSASRSTDSRTVLSPKNKTTWDFGQHNGKCLFKKKKRDEDRKITDKLSRHQWQTLKLISSFYFHLTWNNFFLWSPSFFSEKQYLFTYFVLWKLFLLHLSFLYKFQAFFSHKLFDHISLGLSVVSALCYSMMLPFSPLFVIWSLQNSTSCSSWPRTRYGFSKQFNYYWILSTQTH